MEANGLNTQKRKESDYMEEARRASSVFPAGKLVPHERPDFLLHGDKLRNYAEKSLEQKEEGWQK
jgi:hypothetical protein